jgi:tRNA(Ile)-lysidine synthase
MSASGPVDRPAPWLRRASRALRRWRGAGIVVAVSGGGDSIGLLRVLYGIAPGLGLRLSVAHLDHGVRGEAAATDACFVAELAGSLGLPCDLGRWSPSRPGHFEADARRARYQWLDGVARGRGASAVAVGHTRDDQAETILHRILRGTGTRGLAGMPALRALSDSVTLIRPLLGASRAEVRDFLAAIGQDYREDATNADTARTRARIRHDLLPKLAAEYNPRVAEALVRLGRTAGAADRTLQRRLAALARAATIEVGPEALVLNCGPLATLPAVLRAEALRLAWRRSGWPEAEMSAARWLRLAAMAGRHDRGRFSLGGGIEVWLSDGILRLSPTPAAPEVPDPHPIRFPVPGSAIWGDTRIVASPDVDAPRDEAIDLDRLNPFLSSRGTPFLWVRVPRDGDRFDPLGMDGHTMPLNDFLRGRGVPRERRGQVPLVYDKSGLVWVVGHRIAHRVRITEQTHRILGLRHEPTAGCG